MVSYEDLQQMRVVDLKKAVSEWQHANRIPRFSSMKKADLVDAMHKEIQLGQPMEDVLEKHVARIMAANKPKAKKTPKGKKAKAPESELRCGSVARCERFFFFVFLLRLVVGHGEGLPGWGGHRVQRGGASATDETQADREVHAFRTHTDRCAVYRPPFPHIWA